MITTTTSDGSRIRSYSSRHLLKVPENSRIIYDLEGGYVILDEKKAVRDYCKDKTTIIEKMVEIFDGVEYTTFVYEKVKPEKATGYDL